jgi:hypothetical protein
LEKKRGEGGAHREHGEGEAVGQILVRWCGLRSSGLDKKALVEGEEGGGGAWAVRTHKEQGSCGPQTFDRRGEDRKGERGGGVGACVSKRRIGGGPATTAVGLVGRCGISERGSVWVVGEETGRWAMRGVESGPGREQ